MWARELPRYANWQQSKADWWSLAAGILAAVTGLSVFPVLDDTSTTTEKGIVALGALLSSICALVPRVKNYGEMAGQARELSTTYGPLVGRLLDSLVQAEAGTADQGSLRAVMDDFDRAKARKDTLRFLGRESARAADRTRAEERVAALVPQTLQAPATPPDGTPPRSTPSTSDGSPTPRATRVDGHRTVNIALFQFPARGPVPASDAGAPRPV
ncbi:hypothetical protein N798_01140 [Knoellia flava TL1]|nr:hypothetical protein N798_01140 [Knoellia flava TL1]